MAALFTMAALSDGADNKEGLAVYIKAVSSIMTDADFTIKSISFNTLPMAEGAKRMNGYLGKMAMLESPEALSRQHKMVLLAFKKMRAGLLLFSLERKDMCVSLIKNGGRLLRQAAKDITAVMEREGILKKEDKPAKGE